MGEFGLLFAIPLWLQNVQGLNAVSSGMVLLWLAGGAFLASGVGGALSGKLSPVNAVRIGVALELIAVAGIAFIASAEGGWQAIAPFLAVYGVGVGLATAQLTGVIMTDVPMTKAGQASGSQSTVRQIGSALGIAVIGTTLFTATQASLDARLADIGASTATNDFVSNGVVDSAGGIIPSLNQILTTPHAPFAVTQQVATKITDAAGAAFSDGAKWAALSAAVFLLIGFLSTLRLGSKLHSEGSHHE